MQFRLVCWFKDCSATWDNTKAGIPTAWHNDENNLEYGLHVLVFLAMKFRRPCFIPGKNETVLKPQGFLQRRIISSYLVGIHNVHLGGIFAD